MYFFTVMRLGANFHTSSRSSIMQTIVSPQGKRFLSGARDTCKTADLSDTTHVQTCTDKTLQVHYLSIFGCGDAVVSKLENTNGVHKVERYRVTTINYSSCILILYNSHLRFPVFEKGSMHSSLERIR